MTIRLRTAFFIGVTLFILWFFYLERTLLSPFVLAAIFAYVFNPLVNFISEKIKLPRTISIIVIYIIILSVVVIAGTSLVTQVVNESSELTKFTDNLSSATKTQVESLPFWLKSPIQEMILSIDKSKILSTASILVVFPQAISKILSFFIFLFSGFYFLKEGRNMLNKVLNFIPNNYKFEVEILLRKINGVMGKYLRGQLLLVFLVSIMLFIPLSILGVKFALILAIFSGFAEIIPIIGPIVAAVIASLVVLIGGNLNFGLTPIQGAITIAISYFVIRQVQDYFITPHVMGKIVRLHPLVIFFAVLSGQHMGGILGVILAVPIVAALRIILEFLLDKINERSTKVVRA